MWHISFLTFSVSLGVAFEKPHRETLRYVHRESNHPAICKPFIRDLSKEPLIITPMRKMMENTEDFLNKLVFQNNKEKNPTRETKKASEFNLYA